MEECTVDQWMRTRKQGVDTALIFHTVSPNEVQTLINRIKTQAMGVDGINLKLLKIVLPYCLEALTSIINYSIETNCVPDIWKRSYIIPIPKINKATELSDLRPVNILTTTSKLLEMIIYSQISEFFQKYELLPQVQSGFRPYYSTSTALIKICSDISKNMDNSKVTIMVLLDYSKAFDVINHELLTAKLGHYGLSDTALMWITDYLKNRYQQVKINGNLSDEYMLTHGVPQGSILGPLLFTIFTSDLTTILPPQCNIHMYADDTQVYISSDIKEVNASVLEVNEYLDAISNWSQKNGLILNPKKTTALCIGTKHYCEIAKQNLVVNLQLGESIISFVNSAKNLGVIFDQHLSFERHANSKLSLCYAKLKCLYQYKSILTSNVKWNLVNTLIFTQIDYCSSVYYDHLNRNMQHRLQIMQNSCLRFVYTHINYREHITPVYNLHNILKIDYRFELRLAILIYKVCISNMPKYLFNLLVKRSDVHNLNLRSVNQLAIPKHSTSKFKASFDYKACVIFNKYIDFYFSCPSAYSFKNAIKNKLLNEQKYLT